MDFQQIRKYVKGVLTNSFLNKTTLDKLSTSNEGNLLFDGKELKNIGNIEASITELWSGQQSVSAEITLLDDYANYDIIISMVEPLEDYPTQQKFDFMLKGAESLTGGIAENNTYIASYRLNNWNSTSVYFRRDNNPSGWNLTLRKIWGIKFITQQHNYSTEEQIIGTWIDGKPLYQKTIIVENESGFARKQKVYENTEINILSAEKIMMFVSSEGEWISERYLIYPIGVDWNYNNVMLRYNDAGYDGVVTKIRFTIQYTKTADTTTLYISPDANNYTLDEKVIGT